MDETHKFHFFKLSVVILSKRLEERCQGKCGIWVSNDSNGFFSIFATLSSRIQLIAARFFHDSQVPSLNILHRWLSHCLITLYFRTSLQVSIEYTHCNVSLRIVKKQCGSRTRGRWNHSSRNDYCDRMDVILCSNLVFLRK